MNDKLDNAINNYLSAEYRNLDQLEGDVWARIQSQSSVTSSGWVEAILASILVPKYRFATIAAAIVIGLMLSEAGKSGLSVQPVPATQALSLDVFSPRQGLLLANLGEERL